jgi:hypothetical protein
MQHCRAIHSRQLNEEACFVLSQRTCCPESSPAHTGWYAGRVVFLMLSHCILQLTFNLEASANARDVVHRCNSVTAMTFG